MKRRVCEHPLFSFLQGGSAALFFLKNPGFCGQMKVFPALYLRGKERRASTASEYPLADFALFRSLARTAKIACWGAGLRWRPQSVKRFEALTEPTGETSLCNPSIFLAGAYTGCKNAAWNTCSENTKGSPSLAGTGFLFYRQLQFCHYCKSEKIAIDGDAIYGYTVTASLNDI